MDHLEEWISLLPDAPAYKKRGHEYLNLPCAFDIETSSTYQEEKKVGWMYVWMLGVAGICIVGRTWPEFLTVYEKLLDRYGITESRHLIIYVHNLAYEFQFIRKWLEWENVFAIKPRTPVYAMTKDGIEFRCSYILSNMSLALVGENLRKNPVKKMVGDLDYSLIRHSGTPLTDKEIGYCLNDIRVVMAYIAEKMEEDGNITRIQLTNTGYVRKFVRDKCMYAGSHKKNTWKALNYRNMMAGLQIECEEYKMMKRAFQGGFTHANAEYSGKTLENVSSRDLCSDYPYQMIANRYPMSSGLKVEVKTMKQFREYIRKYCCIFDVEFTNIRARMDAPDHILSYSKCWGVRNDVVDNGRIVSADRVITTVTEVDFQSLEWFYRWDSIRIGSFYRYFRGYLPKPIVESILSLYAAKTSLKGVPEREEEYLRSKGMLNSTYGMMVTDIIRPENTYSGEWDEPKEPDLDEELTKYNTAKKRFLFYAWGLYVTAYARRSDYTAILELKDDYVYTDTDSVKYLNREAHEAFFDRYNEAVVRDLQRAMDHHGLSMDLVMPKTVKGTVKLLGAFEYEGTYDRFKTLGAKRYMVEKDGKISITVSGVNKSSAIPWMEANFEDPFEAFSQDLEFPPKACGKMTHTYIDEASDGIVKDYRGRPGEYHERSSIHLEGCEYSMSLADDYIEYLEHLAGITIKGDDYE